MKHPEAELQKACVKWFRLQYPQHRIIHIPNGGKRGGKMVKTKSGKMVPIEAGILKAMGVSAGFPDLMILTNGGDVMFIEMKSENGRATDNQIEWERWLKEANFIHATARTFGEFEMIANEFVNPLPW